MHDWTALVRRRLAALSHGGSDDGLIEELALHLSQTYDDTRAGGATDAEAYARAMQVLDASEALRGTIAARAPALPRQISNWSRHEAPAERGGGMPALDITRDVRHALRLLLRAPAFSAIAMLTFAVGIGINTAVFNVVHGVLLQPLPYPDADRITLIWVDNRRQGIREDITSYPAYLDWRTRSTSYAHMAAFRPQPFSLTGAGEPERLQGAAVTASFFDVMGIRPSVGRVFLAEHETPGKDGVVVISHGLWQRQFGGGSDVLGRTLHLGGRPYEIIGVMPPALRWPDRAELWTPLAPNEQLRDSRNSYWLPVIGRLKTDVAFEQAYSEMAQIGARLEQEYPQTRGYGVNVVPLHQQLVGRIERPLLVLLAAVGFVLLIACANLSNLMLGRTAARQRELAIRTALGAGRLRLVRQIVTEAFVLALLGSAIGVAIAFWATRFFVAIGGDSIPRQDAIAMNAAVLGFTLLLASIAALLAGLVPALQASRRKVADHLREGARTGTGIASRRLRSALVVAEVSMALVLLTGAGLLVRTLWSMQRVERGFDGSRVAMTTIGLPATTYPRAPEVRAFYSRLLERLRALPGVQSAAFGTGVLQALVTSSNVYEIEGRPLPPPEDIEEYPVESVSPGYFETLGMTVLHGRSFTDADHGEAPRVVVINETLARTGWPGQDPIGRRIRSAGDTDPATNPWMTVVGVIRNAHRADVTRAVRPELYTCALQSVARTQIILLRTAGEPAPMLADLRREIRALDPQLPVFNATTLDAAMARTLTQPRFQAVLLAGFAIIALLLATIGIYGVTSHAVSQRTREVGIRMAMGAKRRDVLVMMLIQQLRPALMGLLLGVIGSLLLSRFVQTLLFGVSATDPLTFTLVAVSLLVVAAFACWIPARRATKVDPLVALRAE